MQKVYIVHGYGGTPDKHWFAYVENALNQLGIECHRLAMPDTDNPNPDKWLAHLENHTEIDEHTVLIGHSLGCIATLNFLARNYKKPKGVILVSGFYQPLPNLPELTIFSNIYAVSPPISATIKSYVIAALDDTIVPHQYSDDLAKHLNADYIRLPTGGHFLGEEGWTEMPLVVELVRKLFNQ